MMRFLLAIFLIPFISTFASTNAYAKAYASQNQQFTSQAGQVSLIELFSSEGCHSCPPAENWLNNLKTKKNLWDDFVPVAFHVDYWDYIGWKDVYAKPKNTERQRLYALEHREPSVYTPGVRAEGKEWRNWRRANLGQLANVERDKVGVLGLEIIDSEMFKANFELAQENTLQQMGIKGRPYVLTVALLGLGISTPVKRGENKGKTLEHDFIVLESLDYEVLGKQSQDSKKPTFTWKGKLPVSELEAPRYAIAAWVSSNKSLRPIQAVGGFLE